MAYLVERLTEIRRILILESNNFVGLLSTRAIKSNLINLHKELAQFERQMGKRQKSGIDFRQEAEEIMAVWNQTLPSQVESTCQRTVTQANLRWWFDEAMLGQALKINDLGPRRHSIWLA